MSEHNHRWRYDQDNPFRRTCKCGVAQTLQAVKGTVNARQAPKDRKQAVLRRRFDSLLGDGYDPEFLAPLKAAADLIDEQGAEILHLREQIAALESHEVCTVAHDNVETCGYCQRDAALARAEAAAHEAVAAWMIEHAFATGHGDTLTDLLAELSWQIAEIKRDAIKGNYIFDSHSGISGL